MNDLERDLHELFDQRARDVNPAGLAPESILRRGRRRQARTVIGGALAGVVVLAVAMAAVGSVQRSANVTPGGSNDLPARTTNIGGVPVTAPAGWTLIDDWPLAAQVVTSTQSCSFSGSGTAVDANGSPIADSPQPEPSQSCSSEAVSPAPALPVLQLANFEIPLVQTVCGGLGDNDPAAALPANGVAVYVVAYPVEASNGDGSDTSFAEGCGTGSTTMTQFFSADRTIRYAAIVLQGSEASPEDTTFAGDYINSLDRMSVSPTTWDSPRGPGYVLAAGGTEQEGWRLEAGFASFANNGRPTVGSIFVTTEPGSEKAKADATLLNSGDVDLVGDQVVQHGNLAEGFTGVDVAGSDGAVTHADVYAWPQGLLTIAGSQALDGAGGIWVATPPHEGDVTFISGTGSQQTPAPQVTPEGNKLHTRMDDSGNLVIFGHDLGHDWEIRHDQRVVRFFVDGVERPEGGFAFTTGASTAVDVDGGTFLIGVFDRSVMSWSVEVDATDSVPAHTIDGGSAAAQDASGKQANVWLVALPGSGTGTASGISSLPTFVSWPTWLYPDGLFGAGSDGVVSWGIAHHTDQCAILKVIGADPADDGESPCFPSWFELSRNGDATPLIGGVYGKQNATVTIVLLGETPVATSGRTPDCFTVRVESNFANTEFCVFSLPIGQTTTVAFGDSGTAFDGPINITALPGRLNLQQQGSASATPSP